MTDATRILFGFSLTLLVILSAFFSIAETALMSVNRYRLRHKARLGHKSSILILKLLKRPDRLLGMILIGNCVANIVASALLTYIASHYFGDNGVVLATVALTMIILIFSEVAPKTVAALYPDKVSTFVSWPIKIMLVVFYPFVWLINFISNGLLTMLNIKFAQKNAESLSREELRSIVYDTAGKMPIEYQSMLLGILDLNQVSVDDVMIPVHEIFGINIDQPFELIREQIATSSHDWVPIYEENLSSVIGVLHMRELTHVLIKEGSLSEVLLREKLYEAYYVPEGTPLNVQLLNFQQNKKRMALVVDEYGEIQGLITLEDILEEIVGEFTTTVLNNNRIELQKDGSYLVDGGMTLRELNRQTSFNFDTSGPKTLNGLILEELQAMPVTGICIKLGDYPVELMEVKNNRVHLAKILPKF